MYRASHILIAHQDAMRTQRKCSREEAAFLINQIHHKILSGETTFEQAAQDYSDCPSGKANNGDLGAFNPKQMDQDFIAYLDGLQPGEMSGPCVTVFGFHIIRRNQPVNIIQSP